MAMLNRRSFLRHSLFAGAGALVPLSLVGCSGSGSNGAISGAIGGAVSTRDLLLTSMIEGQTVNRNQVLEWEARRLQIVAQRMQNNLPAAMVGELLAMMVRPATSIENVASEREVLADAKMRAGDAAMRALVANDMAVTTPAAELAVLAPLGWAISEIDIISNRGTAEGFANWFSGKNLSDNQRAMLVACPDHYLLHPVLPNGVMVIETTGGATQATYIVIDYDNVETLPIVVDPNFPVHFNGVAKSEHGTTIGGLNHRFRTLVQGFHSHLAIFFPGSLPPTMISEHRWHLACEFSNWITAYIAETGD